MLTDKESGQSLRQSSHDVDAVENFEVILRDPSDHDDNELPDDSDDSFSLMLIRMLPLIHGGFVGGTLDNLVLGLSAGMALSVSLDLCMGNASQTRPLFRRLATYACPGVAVTARRLAMAIKRSGLSPPATLFRLKCETPQSG